MPKDWRYHKAEVERLYTHEGKSLEEIRDILREEHGFSASMRAYRLRIDTWGLTQNNSSVKTPQSASSKTDLMAVSDPTTHPSESGVDKDWIPASQPESPREARGPLNVATAFEMLLSKWKPSTASTLLCFQHPDYREWVEKSNNDNGPIIFKLIEVLVPRGEQPMLYKAFLEADLLSHSDPDYPFPAWRYAWNMLLRCDDSEDDVGCGVDYCSEDWERATDSLGEDEVISQVAGQAFLDCALVVLAERRLTACRMDPHYWNRRKYLYILKSFRHLEVDVDPSFYKDSLQMFEVDELDTSQDSLRKRAELADEYRHKYLRLVDRYSLMRKRIGLAASVSSNGRASLRQDSTHSTDPHQAPSSQKIAAEQYPSPDTAMTLSSNDHPSSPEGTLTNPDSPVLTTRDTFDLLISKWKTLNDFTEYVHSIITGDGWAISVFESCPVGGDNLFDIIHAEVPETERIPLMTALLVAFSSVNLTSFYSPWSIHWWTSVYNSPSWDKFLSRLDLPRITSQLERVMKPDTVKTFMDCAFLLVGERTLLNIKTKMVAAKRRGMNEHEKESFNRLHKQYLDILRDWYAREMKVDQTWTYYLMNIC
ncbi:hypothetical protein VTL71DRAFT_9331 [Oculimacula yallundae]|uniref:Clr5 domain-containing protein n=1 Tax=Oculimacula yallundae TaxID=86028 RepID=A0ABR4BSX2_9HELO